MYSKTTKKVNITVEPFFLEDQSEPDESHYVWAYKIIIDNIEHALHKFINHKNKFFAFFTLGIEIEKSSQVSVSVDPESGKSKRRQSIRK